MNIRNLSDYIVYLLSKGELILKKAAALEALDKSDAAIRNSIKRQVHKKKLIPLFRGFYLIIPPEYQSLGFVPPDLFIDDLMKEVRVSYYIGLLSAASFHGSSHQAVQTFQVMVNKRLKPISLGRSKIVFYYNKRLEDISVQQLKTDRGPITISTPETTAFDLIRYFHQSGHLNHVATVLKELGEKLSDKKLKKLFHIYPVVSVQRLGYLMDLTGHHKVSKNLAEYIKGLNCPFVALKPQQDMKYFEKNLKWRLLINEKIEPDL